MLPSRTVTKARRSEMAMVGSASPSTSTKQDTPAKPANARPRSPAIGVARPRATSAQASSTTAPVITIHPSASADGNASDVGTGTGSSSIPQKERKRKKRGWKGYAMQYFDADGNLVEERIRDESPPKPPTEEEKAVAAAAAAAAIVEATLAAEEAAAVAAALEVKDGSGSALPGGSREASTSASRVVHQSHSATPEVPPTARLETTAGSKPILIISGPAAEPASTAPDASTSKAESSRAAASKEDKAPLKKRRKTSLSQTPQPDARGLGKHPNGKGKGRSSLPNPIALTARQLALTANTAAYHALREAKEAASFRASPYVVEDDAPLPKVPRRGMGEDAPDPPQSDIRGEAAFIIAEAEKARQERARKEAEVAGMAARQVQPVTPPLTGSQDDIPPLRVALPNGDHSTSYRTPAPTGNGLTDSISQQSPRKQPEPTTDEEFAEQFERMQNYYTDTPRHAMPIFVDDPRAPKFHEGQKPTVILANPSGRMPGRVRDKHERAYLEGFDGLPEDYEREIVGFIDNVKSNMRTVVQFYFDHSTLRRDAFIERLGRELSILGSQLTTDGEAAIQLPRQSPPSQ